MDDAVLIEEVLALTLAYQQGDATDEERARLERLLADDPRAIGWYLRVVEDTLTLYEAVDAEQNGSAAEQQSAARWLKSIVRGAGSHMGWLAAACVLLMLAGLPWWWAGVRSSADGADRLRDGQAAQVVSISDVRWAEGAEQFREWSLVQPGDTLKFDSGLVSLFLANGVELLVEGPADVDLVSLQKAVARQGKLVARVGPRAHGFCIETPHANVIDRGTSFGMSIDQDCRTSVVVYEGMIDLDVLADSTLPRRRLATGEALSVDRYGHLSRITTVQSADFLEPLQIRMADAAQDRVITSVSDNVRLEETSKYYRIVPRGFREDCRAYVDRLHEWNGLDERGLPPFLVGGDYVMTFNDDKIVAGIEIAVTISQPANVYVLLDDRVEPPEWLKRDFVDTGWDVGSDEGWSDRIIDTALGPGQSIDHVCSVWRREVREPSTVVLGSLAPDSTAKSAAVDAVSVERSMYGVVATPLMRPLAADR